MRPRRMARNVCLLRNCLIATGSGLVVGSRAGALTINLSYDSTVTSLPYAASVESATFYAAQQIESLFSDNITLNINVTSSSNAFGGSGYSLGYPFTYSAMRSDLIASASTPTDTTAYATLPSSPDPTSGGTFAINGAQQKALGLAPGNGSGNDGTFVFGNNQPWTFDPNNRAVSGDYDFIGVAEHEITEIMGRNGGLGQGSPALYRTADLFRYSGVGQHNFNQAATNTYFSIDGGITDLMDYPSGTEMDWANGLTDAFDTASVQGTENGITPADIAMMDILGYHALTSPVINHMGTGNWSVPGSWNPGSVPGAGQGAYLCYGDGVSRTINYDYTGMVTLYSLELDLAGATGSATTKLSMSANNLTVSGFEIIGRNGSGFFNQSGGVNTVNGINGLFLGYNTGATGTYALSSTGTLTVAGNEFVGNSGTGTFTQTGGMNSAYGIVIANNAGSTGTYTLSGTGSISAGNHEIIGGSGNGTLTQIAGTNTYSSYLTVADQPGSTGQYNMQGGSLQGAYMGAGQQGQGTFAQSAGTVNITDHLSIGDHPSATGTYTLSSTGQLTANFEYIGYQGNGTFTQSGGTNTSSAYLTVADQPGGVGLYTMQAGSMQTGYMGAGQQGQGTVTQSGGTITVNDHLSVGDHPGSTGFYNLSGTGQLTTNFEYIAYEGAATFTQSGGTQNINGALSLGVFGGSNGTFNLSAGTTTITGSAYVGGWGGGAGGAGTITVSSTGQLTIDGTLVVYSPGKVNINGGTTTVGGLSISPGGIVNVTTPLLINYGAGNQSPLSTIESYIRSGYNHGTWNGSGIVSSSITSSKQGVGYLDNGNGTIKVKYALLGDTNLDGTVNFADLLNLAQHYNSTNSVWATGDFNYDGTTNFADLLALAQNYNGVLNPGEDGVSPSFAAEWNLAESEISAVPEPGSLALAACGVVAMLMGRRRRRRATNSASGARST